MYDLDNQPMIKNISLKKSWTVVALIAVIVPVLFVMVWYGTTMYQHELDSALKIERQANEQLENQIVSEIKRYRTLLQNKSDPLSFLVDKPDNPEALREINTLLRIIAERETAIQELIILSPQADVIAAIDPAIGLTAKKPFTDSDKHIATLHFDFDKTRQHPEIVIAAAGRSYIGPLKKHENFTAFSMAEPIGNPAKAVLVGLINLEKLWQSNSHIDHVVGSQMTRDYMLDRRGSLITEVSGGHYKPGDLMTHMEIARTALIDGKWSANTSYMGITHQPVYGTLTTIPILNWALISEVTVSDITQPIWTSLIKIAALTLLGTLIFIGFILRLVRQTLRPIQHVCKAIDHVAMGEYQFVLEPSGIRELDGLANAFKHMAKARQDSENLLREREQDLAITLNGIGGAVIATDAKGSVTRMNPVAEKLSGWVFEQAKGKSLQNIFPIINATTHEMIPIPIAKVVATGVTIHVDNCMMTTRESTEYYITSSIAPIRDGKGNIQGTVLVCNDVTEQFYLREKAESAQQALEHKEKEQREILNSMLDGVICTNEAGNIISFNKAAENLFGYSIEEIMGKNVGLLMPGPDTGRHDAYMQNYLKTGISQILGANREVMGQHKDQHVFPISVSVAELPSYESDERRFIATCQDLTHAKQQEEQIRRAQKMDALGKLTGGIAHDFNNILNVVIGYAALLKEQSESQPKTIKYSSQIHRAGIRGASLTKKLLSFSRQETPEAAKIDINTLLQEQEEMLQKTLTVRVKLVIDLAKDVWPIWLDSHDLEDAIINMSINAMHAMSGPQSTAQLTICTRCQSLNTFEAEMLGLLSGDYVLLSIKDTGIGMNQTTKEKIFDPFFTTKGENGTGLGLSQVFGFVKRAGGTIKVFSKPGQGSQFVLYFPRCTDADLLAESSEDNIDLRGTEKILIVDDEAALRDLTSELLSQQGYQIFCGENGKQALQILEHEDIDLMLSDVIMPELDGYQLATIVQEKYPDIKIQLASGFTDERHLDVADQSLHKNLIYKPYEIQSLLKSIRALLDNRPNLRSEKQNSA